ncbi:MAG: hypothetical protein KBD78_14875 [Oligoflexales bacterium]|nr:hypothetical protein [Oligoflexales bacterium]
MPNDKKLKIAVWKFASCDGCQLSLLDCEDELLTLTEKLDLAYFPEASSRMVAGPYDISLVEGSLSLSEDFAKIKDIRKNSQFVVAIGACATYGGIQALRNSANIDDYKNVVYAHPEFINTLDKVTPISKVIKVDYELYGCPINKQQLLELLNALLNRRRPQLLQTSVCYECKLAGNTCIMISENKACLGGVTRAGCGAICPTYGRGCFACYGPKDNALPEVLATQLEKNGKQKSEIFSLLLNFNPEAKELTDASKKYEY